MRVLRSTLAYFTILPVGAADAPDAETLAWLPVAGALVGAISGAAALGVAAIAPHPLAVAVAFGAPLVLTGAIHLDGFLDGCDAFFAAVPPTRRLEILKDPRHGTFALAGLAVAGVAWLAALASLAPRTYPLALALAGAVARWSAVIHALRVPYGRAGASARAFDRRPSLVVLGLGALLIVVLASPFGLRGAIACVLALGCAASCVAWIQRRLGGVLVGDAYGFTIVVTEVVTLLALA
jgi:adenosylcobinamide-GDP ribazoletransferase